MDDTKDVADVSAPTADKSENSAQYEAIAASLVAGHNVSASSRSINNDMMAL